MIPVTIIDNSPLTEYGLKQMLCEENNCEIVFHKSYSCGQEALDNINEFVDDLVLIGLQLTDIDSYDLIAYVKAINPNQKIGIYTYQYNQKTILKSIRSNIQGIISKSVKVCDLIEYIKMLYESNKFITSGITQISTNNSSNTSSFSEALTFLTKREKQIFDLLIEGLRNKNISEILDISLSTVEFHRKNIYIKLNVKNIAELITRTYAKVSVQTN